MDSADPGTFHKLRPLTTGEGGDFRPSWSPDGQWIAFSSDRDSDLPNAKGRWERLHIAGIYLVHPDGTGLKRLTAKDENFCGSPKWTADSKSLIAYCMTGQETWGEPGSAIFPPEASRFRSRSMSQRAPKKWWRRARAWKEAPFPLAGGTAIPAFCAAMALRKAYSIPAASPVRVATTFACRPGRRMESRSVYSRFTEARPIDPMRLFSRNPKIELLYRLTAPMLPSPSMLRQRPDRGGGARARRSAPFCRGWRQAASPDPQAPSRLDPGTAMVQ